MRKFAPLILIALFILFGYGLRKPVERIEYRDKVTTEYIHDTIVETEYIYRERLRVDTVAYHYVDERHDTLYVPVPIEYLHERYEQGEVYYHGYNAGIDSLIAYKHTQIVTIERTLKEDVSPWGISVTAGYGVGKGGLTPYIGLGVDYRIVSFRKKNTGRRERGISYE